MNGSTNGWVMLNTKCTMSLPGLATSRSRMIRRIRRTCRIPNTKVTMRDASVAPPGPGATYSLSVVRTVLTAGAGAP